MSKKTPHVGLFVTCIVDMMRPVVGFATLKLLEDAGCRVSVPESQTCCGQPAYNSGDRADASALAKRVIATYEPFDYVVMPSGSCAGMIRIHYPDLFADDPQWRDRARCLADKTFELTGFLADVLKADITPPAFKAHATYHDSCSGLREMGIKDQPRKLLQKVEGLTLSEAERAEECCGFGGTFALKYTDISAAMVDRKVDAVLASGADVVLGGDMGCLMNIAGKITRRGEATQVRHVAEVLSGLTDTPSIGRGKDEA